VTVRSVDTNVLARYLLADDPEQTEVAQRLIASGVHIPLTVLMETSWLLSSRYGLARAVIVQLFRLLRESASVFISEEDHFDWLLSRFDSGADFADLVHLVASKNHSSFTTFDQSLAKQAGNDPPVPIETLP
jgi:predicted nucleic-acid-binding protein